MNKSAEIIMFVIGVTVVIASLSMMRHHELHSADMTRMKNYVVDEHSAEEKAAMQRMENSTSTYTGGKNIVIGHETNWIMDVNGCFGYETGGKMDGNDCLSSTTPSTAPKQTEP